MPTFIVSVEDGRFLVDGESAPLTIESLAKALQRVGFQPNDPNYILMCSSSMDFPEEDGAPVGFNARETLQSAIALLLGGRVEPSTGGRKTSIPLEMTCECGVKIRIRETGHQGVGSTRPCKTCKKVYDYSCWVIKKTPEMTMHKIEAYARKAHSATPRD